MKLLNLNHNELHSFVVLLEEKFTSIEEDEILTGLPIIKKMAEDKEAEFTSDDVKYAALAFSKLYRLLTSAKPRLAEELRISAIVKPREHKNRPIERPKPKYY